MNSSQDNRPVNLVEAVAACTPEFVSEIKNIYTSVDTEIAAIGADCKACGQCCKFDIAGHRLFLSTGELALLASVPPEDMSPAFIGRCPYQVDTKCTARDRRSLGCRVFFCDNLKTEKANQHYETYHSMLRQLHQTHWVPYAYAELTAGLMQLFVKT